MNNKHYILFMIVIVVFIIMIIMSCYKFIIDLSIYNSIVSNEQYTNWYNRVNPESYMLYEFVVDDVIYCYYKSKGFIIWKKEAEGLKGTENKN